MTTSKLVTLESFADPFTGRIVKQRLEEAGIPTFLNGEEAATALGGINPAMVTVKLEVAEEDVERARQILATPVETDTGIQTEPDQKDPPEDLTSPTSVAERALRAALFGLLLVPAIVGMLFQLYSLWLTANIAGRDDEMQDDYAWKVYLALGLDAVGLVLGAFYVRALYIWIV